MKKLSLSFVMIAGLLLGMVGITDAFDDICILSGTTFCPAPQSLTPSLEDPVGNRIGDQEQSRLTLDLVIAGEDGSLSPITCNDGIDNGPDGFTDRYDPDCLPNGVSVETVTLTGPVEIERFLSLGPDGVSGGGDDKGHTVLTGGELLGANYDGIGGEDTASGGEHQIETEIVSMSLTGTSALLGGATITITEPLSESVTAIDRNGDGDTTDTNQSKGKITTESTAPSGSTNFPADSFFDVVVDVAVSGFGSGYAADNERSDGITRPTTSCSDTFDNDGDTLIDLADPDCVPGGVNRVASVINKIPPFAPSDPSGLYEDNDPSPQSCVDNIDNGPDGLTDLADPDCQNSYKHIGNCILIIPFGILICGLNHELLQEGCCEVEAACMAPISEGACEISGGVFYSGDMLCDTETKCSKPTAIRLSSFKSTYQEGYNFITWTTSTEIDTEGFHILRSTSGSGEYSRITSSMIASTGSAYSGGRYSFVDTAVEDGESYYYKLEEVDNKGNIAQYGPVAAVADQGGVSSADLYGRQSGGTIVGDEPPRYGMENKASGLSGEQATGVTPTPTIPHQGGGSVYTIMAYAEGPAKFLSGEVVNGDTIQGIRSQVLEDSSAVIARPEGAKQSHYEGKDEGVAAGGGSLSPASIRFRIIDAEGNEVAVASLDKEDAKSGDFALQNRRDGDRIVLTWYATKPVKGFHILRSAAKDGQYQQITKTPIPYIGTGIEGVTGQIFRFTYTDRNVQKGKDYHYKLEPILREEVKTTSRQK